MKIEEFTRRGPAWHKTVPLQTRYGDFGIQLLKGNPDEQMLNLAGSAATYLQSDIEQVVDIVLAHYHWAVKNWGREAVHDHDAMLKDVGRQNIFASLRERSIIVDKLDDDEELYLCSFSFGVPYDEEHGLHLGFESGRIATVNDSEFKIENGLLKYAWE